jgi:6-phosphogluconolactonase
VRLYVGLSRQVLVTYALAEGTLEPTRLGETMTGNFPSFAALAPSGTHLVVANEGAGDVASLAIAPGTGTTTLVNEVETGGGGTTHVSIDATGRWVFAANYSTGDVVVLPLGADGRLGAPSDTEVAGRNAHAVELDPSQRWLLVPCKGDDLVRIFAFDAALGRLTPGAVHRTAPGAGPRHLAFDRAGRRAYLVNELSSSVDVLSFDPDAGTLAHLDSVSTLPPGDATPNTGAEILVHPAGHTVYASNRGHDSIAIFGVGAEGGLEPRGHVRLEARTPRSMALDPGGTVLVAAGLESSEIVRLAVSPDGSLTRLGSTPVDGDPWYVGLFPIPRP